MAACDQIAAKIIAEHARAQDAARSAVEHARSAGMLLTEAKLQVAHGEWAGWVRDRLPFSLRTAQTYMRVARELPGLDEAKAQRVAHLPLRQLLEALATPNEESESAPHHPEVGVAEIDIRDLINGDGEVRLSPLLPNAAAEHADSREDLRAYYESVGISPLLAAEASDVLWAHWLLEDSFAYADENGSRPLPEGAFEVLIHRALPKPWPSEEASAAAQLEDGGGWREDDRTLVYIVRSNISDPKFMPIEHRAARWELEAKLLRAEGKDTYRGEAG